MWLVALPESVCPARFRLRIHLPESEKRCPTAPGAAAHLPNRSKPRADDNCPDAGAESDASRSTFATGPPAPLRVQKKEAPDFRCRMAGAFRAIGENRH